VGATGRMRGRRPVRFTLEQSARTAIADTGARHQARRPERDPDRDLEKSRDAAELARAIPFHVLGEAGIGWRLNARVQARRPLAFLQEALLQLWPRNNISRSQARA
jgi:hypothetical protein